MTYFPKTIAKAKLYNDNFNHYVTEMINAMTPEQKLLLPMDLNYKIFRKGKGFSAELLTFNEIMWMLQVVFKKNITITVEDEEKGLELKDYTTALKAQRGSITNGELLEKLQIKTAFVLGGKELMSSLLYMSHVDCTGIYNLIKKHAQNANHKENQRFVRDREAFNKTIRFMANYEAIKRRITTDYNLTMPEWYVLLYFATKEGFARDFYDREFVYAYNSSSRNLHTALVRIHNIGYLVKRKKGNKDLYSISAKGMEYMNRIFNNLLLNFV